MAWQLKLAKDRVLIGEGEDSQSMYLVQSGELLVTKGDVTLGIIRSGQLVGELSFLDQKPRSATVTAMTDCTLIQIPRKTIEEVYGSQPKWFEAFIRTLAGRIREADKKIRI